MFGDTFSVLDPKIMSGDWVHHNMTQVTTRGVVQAPESHPEDLPNWILTAMKCMAHCKYEDYLGNAIQLCGVSIWMFCVTIVVHPVEVR